MAYTGGLAKPLVAPPGVAARLTPSVLADFIANNYGAQRMVLAGKHAHCTALCRTALQRARLAKMLIGMLGVGWLYNIAYWLHSASCR